MWIKRELGELLAQLSETSSAIVLTGSRQTGKTSLLQKIFPEAQFVSLDLPLNAEQANKNGTEFLARFSRPIIIDEVQYANNLFRYLKYEIDRYRMNNESRRCLFFLTGSQNFNLMENISESLAGRIAILNCYTLSCKEIETYLNVQIDAPQLFEYIFKGGYPELIAQNLNPERFFSDYVATYLQRDVRQLLNVKNMADFAKFMQLLALRTGQILSLSNIASDLGISVNTVKSWISIMQTSNVIHLLEPFYINQNKRLIKSPKIYFLDTGLCCFLLGIKSKESLRDSVLNGQLFETHVYGQIIKSYANRGFNPKISFFRTNTGAEIDFVIEEDLKYSLIECKISATPSVHDLKVAEFKKCFKTPPVIERKMIVTPERNRLKIDDFLVGNSIDW